MGLENQPDDTADIHAPDDGLIGFKQQVVSKDSIWLVLWTLLPHLTIRGENLVPKRFGSQSKSHYKISFTLFLGLLHNPVQTAWSFVKQGEFKQFIPMRQTSAFWAQP